MKKKRTSLTGVELEKMTPTEREVFFFLTSEFLTPKKISIRRGTSLRATQKTIQNLKEKGLVNKEKINVRNFHMANEHSEEKMNHHIRLHGQKIKVNLLYKDHRYTQIQKKNNIIYIDGNTIQLHRDSIQIHSLSEFVAEDSYKATARSLEYFTRLLIKLESKLKVILIKARSQNIKIYAAHYAEVNNGFAKKLNVESDKLKIYAKEDGKLWLMVDNSFNLHELETQHPETAEEDMTSVKNFFNDIRENKTPTMSDLLKIVKQIQDQNLETAKGLNAIAQLMKPQPQDIDTPIEKKRPDYIF